MEKLRGRSSENWLTARKAVAATALLVVTLSTSEASLAAEPTSTGDCISNTNPINPNIRVDNGRTPDAPALVQAENSFSNTNSYNPNITVKN